MYIHRTATLVTTLADYAAETALQAQKADWIARASVYFTKAVERKTVLVLARLRTALTLRREGREHTQLCEELLTLRLGERLDTLNHEEQARYFAAEPAKNMPHPIQKRHLAAALEALSRRRDDLERRAMEHADRLLEDHRRIRDAAKAKGSYAIAPVLPPDILGLVVLVPSVKEL